MNKAYISLGSNEGQRLESIRKAVIQIQKRIGVLTDLSSLYETPAWGFEGPDFLNACIGIKTGDTPLEVLENLLAIEQQMGRKRSLEFTYSSRTIDLDLLFYEDQVIDNENLKLPHPRLELRKFILYPMCEIDPDLVHPRLGKSLSELSRICKDSSQTKKLPIELWSPNSLIKEQILVFEGNIGVGKTSLTQKIARDYQVPSLMENFNQNPYLEKFYDKPERFALRLENYFLEDRFSQFTNFLQTLATSKTAVTDHSLFKSLIFAKINLSPTHFSDFKKNFEKLSAELFFTQRVIFLNQPIKKLMQQIENRGRSYERKITSEYLEKIEEGYQNFQNSELSFPYQKIELTNFDFVHDERAYQIILQRIKAF